MRIHKDEIYDEMVYSALLLLMASACFALYTFYLVIQRCVPKFVLNDAIALITVSITFL